MPIPSPTWFPSSLADRAAWFQNFSTKFSALAAGLGFLPAEVTSVQADNSTVQALTTYSLSVDTFEKGVTAFRKEVLEGKPSATPASPPAVPDLGDVDITLPGVYERLDNLVKRIKLSPTYSDEEGSQLGIIPSKSDPIAPNEMQPTLKNASLPSNVVQVGFKRGKSNGITVDVILDKAGSWTNMGSYFTSPAVLNIPQGPDELPRAVQVRARYLEKGVQVGQWPETYNVVTNP
jgi:hypothetical protein